MTAAETRWLIARLEDLCLAKAIGDPELPRLHREMMRQWEAWARRDFADQVLKGLGQVTP